MKACLFILLWLVMASLAIALSVFVPVAEPMRPLSRADRCQHRPINQAFAWTRGGSLICLQEAVQ